MNKTSTLSYFKDINGVSIDRRKVLPNSKEEFYVFDTEEAIEKNVLN